MTKIVIDTEFLVTQNQTKRVTIKVKKTAEAEMTKMMMTMKLKKSWELKQNPHLHKSQCANSLT